MRVARSVTIAAAVAAIVCAASSGQAAAASICLAKTRTAVARDLHVKPAAVALSAGQGGNGMPQCRFKAGRVAVTVNVDSAPQADWRLMRTVDEATQIFGPKPKGWHAPIGLSGLGPYASWFINLDALMADNRIRTELLTATVVWKHAKRAAMIRLARAAILPYFRRPA